MKRPAVKTFFAHSLTEGSGRQVVLAPACDLRPHPENERVFGRPSEAVYASVRQSIRENGVLEPLDVVPVGARQNPLCVVNGNMRLEIAMELGIEELPVLFHEELLSHTDQIVFMVESAKRKAYDQRQRAHQEQILRETIVAAPNDWKIAYNARRENEVVARATGATVYSVKQRKRVFFGKTTTETLKNAVVGNRVRLAEAVKLIQSAEETHGEGTDQARLAVDDAVRERSRKRRRRGPRLPNFATDAPPKPHSTFWTEVKQLVLKWAVQQAGRDVAGLSDMMLHVAISDCAADVRAAIDELRRKAEKQAKTAARFASVTPTDRLNRINRLLGELGVSPARRGQPVEIAPIKKAHKRLARQYHPDFTANDPTRTKKFVEKQAVYKELMGLVEAHNDTFNSAACA